MKKIKLIAVAALSTLLLSGCKGKQSSAAIASGETSQVESVVTSTTEADQKRLVTKEQFDKEITDLGFFVNQNLSFEGTVVMGVSTFETKLDIANNSTHFVSSMGNDDYVVFDIDTLTEDNHISLKRVYTEPGDTEPTRYREYEGDFADFITQSSYIFFVDYDSLQFEEASSSYILKAAFDINISGEEMIVKSLSYQFDEGKLVKYSADFSSKETLGLSMKVNYEVKQRGGVSFEIPSVTRVSSEQFNSLVMNMGAFSLGGNTTIEGEVNDCGNLSTFKIELDDFNIQVYEKTEDKEYKYIQALDEATYNEETGDVSGTFYRYNYDTGKWSSNSSSFGRVTLSVISKLFPICHADVEYKDQTYVLENVDTLTFSNFGYYDVVLESGTLVFENYQLSSYKFTYYEEGQKGNPDCTTTVSMRVTDRGHTTVTIPTI